MLIPTLAAQDLAKKAANTELQSFAAETGVVIIKGYTELGEVTGMGRVSVDCKEFTNGKNGKKSYGIAIQVKESGQLEREGTSYIDYEEISSLLAGIDYVSKVTSSVTKLKQFEATYATKDNFSITVFNGTNGQLSAAVSCGFAGRTSAYLSIQKLAELRRLIMTAKDQLETIKSS
jgi:hypothetical protein